MNKRKDMALEPAFASEEQREKTSNSVAEKRRKKKLRKKRRRDILITAAVFVAVAVAVVLILRFSMKVDTVTLTDTLYKYQVTTRVEYDGVTTLSYDDGVSVLQNGEATLQLDPEPLYVDGENSVIVPQDMIVVLPDRPLFAKVQHFSKLTSTDTGVQLSRGRDRIMVSRGFLYDGRDRYLFLGSVKLIWGEEWTELSPLSYVIVQPDSVLLYLDHQKDECVMLDTGVCTVKAVSESGYELDMTNDKMTVPDRGEMLLFADPAGMEPLMAE